MLSMLVMCSVLILGKPAAQNWKTLHTRSLNWTSLFSAPSYRFPTLKHIKAKPSCRLRCKLSAGVRAAVAALSLGRQAGAWLAPGAGACSTTASTAPCCCTAKSSGPKKRTAKPRRRHPAACRQQQVRDFGSLPEVSLLFFG